MLSGVNINIVRPGNLPADPFVRFIEEQTQAHCHVINASQSIENMLPQHGGTTLTLIDGQDINGYQPLHIYNTNRNQSDLFAFFNISSGSEIEQVAGELDIHGLFYNDLQPETITRGIKAILNGELWLPRKMLSEQVRKTKNSSSNMASYKQNHDVLTNREIEILSLIATGAKNTDIAQNLSLSVHTIKTHIYHIYKKIDVSNRMQAVNWASQNL